MPEYDWGPDEPEIAEKQKPRRRRRGAAKARAKDSPAAAATMLASVIGAYRATREADWESVRRGPLEAAVATLTAKHEPGALEAVQAQWLGETMGRFARLFPDEFEAMRLSGAEHGFEAIAARLATAEVPAADWRRRQGEDEGEPVRRRFADPRHELVRPFRSSNTTDTSWVV